MSATESPACFKRLRVAFALSWLAGSAFAQSPTLDSALRERIDAFVESERKASGIPGVALVVAQMDGPAHVAASDTTG